VIKLTDIDGKAFYLAPAAILQIDEAGTSSRWHGINTIIRTFDKRTVEVRERADQVIAAMESAPA
jgi:uncharacterized protein YlzI (FlbEa/FlbD family)